MSDTSNTSKSNSLTRRDFLKTTAVAATALAGGLPALAQSEKPAPKIKLGLDNFSIRAMKWKAPQLIDYAVSLKTDSLFITDLDCFENFEDNYLKDLRQRAADHDLQIHVGNWSICPTSKAFRPEN